MGLRINKNSWTARNGPIWSGATNNNKDAVVQ